MESPSQRDGSATSYVADVLETVEQDRSLREVKHPWKPVRSTAAMRSLEEGFGKATLNRRRRRRQMNQQHPVKLHKEPPRYNNIDLKQTHRDISRNRSLLESAIHRR